MILVDRSLEAVAPVEYEAYHRLERSVTPRTWKHGQRTGDPEECLIAALAVVHVPQRDGRWLIDLVGKHHHVRLLLMPTNAVPPGIYVAQHGWSKSSSAWGMPRSAPPSATWVSSRADAPCDRLGLRLS